MFDRVAPRYDLLNDLLSIGMARWWRRRAVSALEVGPGDLVLDLGCGTGALATRLAGRTRIVAMDPSAGMLARARELVPEGVFLVRASASALPFPDHEFAGAISGFVLRNLQDLPKAFSELARVIRPDGSLVLVDIGEPANPLFRKVFDAYFHRAAPLLGSLVGQQEAYRDLVRSLGQIPSPSALCETLRQAGFEPCEARPLTGGIATLIVARRVSR